MRARAHTQQVRPINVQASGNASSCGRHDQVVVVEARETVLQQNLTEVITQMSMATLNKASLRVVRGRTAEPNRGNATETVYAASRRNPPVESAALSPRR